MSRQEAREDLAEPVTFRRGSYGVVCVGPGGCGAVVPISEQDRHEQWHRTLVEAIPTARGDAD